MACHYVHGNFKSTDYIRTKHFILKRSNENRKIGGGTYEASGLGSGISKMSTERQKGNLIMGKGRWHRR